MAEIQRERVEARLKALKLSAYKAAESEGLARTFFYMLLNGKKDSIQAGNYRRAARALHCSIEYLTGESPEVGLRPPSAQEAYSFPSGGIIGAQVLRLETAPAPTGRFPGFLPLPDYEASEQLMFLHEHEEGRGISFVLGVKPGEYILRKGPLHVGACVVLRRVTEVNGKRYASLTMRALTNSPEDIALMGLAPGADGEAVVAVPVVEMMPL